MLSKIIYNPYSGYLEYGRVNLREKTTTQNNNNNYNTNKTRGRRNEAKLITPQLRLGSLIHFSRKEFLTLINRTSSFPFEGLFGDIFHFNITFYKQTVETLIRRRVSNKQKC